MCLYDLLAFAKTMVNILKTNANPAKPEIYPEGWFGWWKSRLVSTDSIVFCERE
jgi:hypothetical protein